MVNDPILVATNAGASVSVPEALQFLVMENSWQPRQIQTKGKRFGQRQERNMCLGPRKGLSKSTFRIGVWKIALQCLQ